jgi:hypothetical protein
MDEALPWDEQALTMVAAIERVIVDLRLDSQGQFVAILNAIEMQIESGAPHIVTVANLGDALLNLASARGIDPHKLRLPQQLHALLDRLLETAGLWSPTR